MIHVAGELCGGSQGWMMPADAAEAAELDPERTVRLLPAFDPFVVGATLGAGLALRWQ